jgi:hypothetical protein
MTLLAAPISQNPVREEGPVPYLLRIDRLERRLCRVHPLRLFLDYFRQFTIGSSLGLVIGAGYLLLRHVLAAATGSAAVTPVEIQVYSVTAVVTFLWTVAVSLFAITVRRFWRVGGLIALALAVLATRYLVEFGAKVAPAIDVVIETVEALSPIVAAMLLGVLVFTSLYYAHLLWVLGRAGLALLLMNASQRAIVRDLPSWQVNGFFSRFWGFPPLYRFARRSKARHAAIIVLSVAAALFFSIASVVPLTATMPIEDFRLINEQWCPGDAACMLGHSWRLLGQFAFPFAAVFGCVLAGMGAQWLLRRLLRFSLEELQEMDGRAPVLFLRAFKDDQVPLRPPRLAAFGRLLELGQRSNSLDQLLLEEVTPVGPVVGLGNPDDKRPPYGAARGYFDHKTWQEAVADLADNAALIVICIDASDGIWWEVEHLVGRQHLQKTLFLLHPRYASASENASILQRIVERAGKPLVLDMPAGGPAAETTIGFFQDRSGGTCAVRSSTFSRFAYLLTVRAFVRERLGLLPASLAERTRWPERL